jgi:predicted ATP-binding protein involved in virulence
MKILSVRVKNFRSIVDSGCVPLSHDGVTVFVGQNESGKTSLLDAINCVVGGAKLSADDTRVDEALPEVELQIDVNRTVLEEHLKEISEAHVSLLESHLEEKKGKLTLKYTWKNSTDAKSGFSAFVGLVEDGLGEKLKKLQAAEAATDDNATEEEASEEEKEDLEIGPLAVAIDRTLPKAVLFQSQSGLLPNHVDINDSGELIGEGAQAAKNFLAVADIKTQDLINVELRSRQTIINRANRKISDDFNSFWSQLIGKTGKLSLEFDYQNHEAGMGEKSGKPHLVFWISDGNTRLYPKQRSLGVRWFVSFYLQLKASEKNGHKRIFLLDEPGANLHSKAQADVLKLINKLSTETLVIYTTHSPHLIEYDKLYRVHAVQRADGDEDSPSVVIDAHQLGTASSDTLSPVLTAMGADFTQQEVIKRTNNVLLEEMSGYYYFKAFWKLTNTEKEAHFIATSGANKLEPIAGMFRGWGLEFVVALDDDSQGRTVYKNLKRNLFGDDEELAKKKLYRIQDCSGIEDIFSKSDFKKFILKDEDLAYTSANTAYLRNAGRSKPVMAYQFLIAVNEELISWTDFDAETQNKITEVVDAVKERLA